VEEIAIMKEIRWWGVAEVEASVERIFPVDLATRMREFGCGEWEIEADSLRE